MRKKYSSLSLVTTILLITSTVLVGPSLSAEDDITLFADHLCAFEFPQDNPYNVYKPHDVCAIGDFAYVAMGDDGLCILDVSDPAAPEIAATFDPDSLSYAWKLDISGDHAYVIGDDTAFVLNISNPTAPVHVGYLPVQCVYIADIVVVDNTAFIAPGGDSPFSVLDVSDPTNPLLVGEATPPDGCQFEFVHVEGDYAYVIANKDYVETEGAGLYIFDVSSPTVDPEMVPVGYGPGWGAGLESTVHAKGVYASGTNAYVITPQGGVCRTCFDSLLVFDVIDVTAPIVVWKGWTGTIESAGGSGEMYVDGGYAYIDDAHGGGISVIDMADPTNPLFIGEVLPDESLIGNGLFFANGLTYYIYDLSLSIYRLDVAPCCGHYSNGYTGNTNCDGGGDVTLSDITRLIDFVFVSKEPLCCEGNGNTNGSEDGKITLSDITSLIDHVYISKSETAICQ